MIQMTGAEDHVLGYYSDIGGEKVLTEKSFLEHFKNTFHHYK